MKDVLRAQIWKTIKGAKISESLFAEIGKKYGADKAATFRELLLNYQESYLFLGKSFNHELPKEYQIDADEVASMLMYLAVKKIELLTDLESVEFKFLRNYAEALLSYIQLLDNRDKLGNARPGIKIEEYAEALDNAEVRLRTAEGFLIDSLEEAKIEIFFAAMEIFALFINYVFEEESLNKLLAKYKKP